MRKYIIALSIIIIIVTINYIYFHSAMSGIWVGSEDFLQKAGLSDLILYIDESGGGTLVISPAEGDPVDLEISAMSYPNPLYLLWPNYYSGIITVDGADDVWPGSFSYTLDGGRGELILKNEDEVYAKLKKDYISEL